MNNYYFLSGSGVKYRPHLRNTMKAKEKDIMNGYQNMVVIFIDLLGTKNNKRYEDKYLIHRLFHEEAKINEKRNLDHVIYDRKVFSFSDCAFVIYYYKDGIEESKKNDMKLIQVAMYNTSISLLRILNAGYLIRGGVTFGQTYFDELGFFGPAIERAYKLESDYADIPIIAVDPDIGETYCKWERKNTDNKLIEYLMTSRPMLVETDKNKYFVNIFYQLEYAMPILNMPEDNIDLEEIKHKLFGVIKRDKGKYKDGKSYHAERKKSTIYEKLDWFERYLSTKHNRLKLDIVEGGISFIAN